MEGESSAYSGSRLNYRLSATPAAAGAIPPSTCPVTTRLLALYQECVDNGVWARVLYEACDGIEKLTFPEDASTFTPAWTKTGKRAEACA
jgi:hypothetical protein